MEKNRIDITDAQIKEDTKYINKVIISNPITGCKRRRKPFKKNGQWGIITNNIFNPFDYAQKVTFQGRKVFVRYYVNYN